jgi:hypothetical protein
MAFTSHADAAFDVCFENTLVSKRKAFASPPIPPFLQNINIAGNRAF